MGMNEEELRRFLTEHEPEELREYIVTPGDLPRVEGSGAVLLSGDRAAQVPSGLVIPESAVPAPIDYVGVYITLEEYVPTAGPVRYPSSPEVAQTLVSTYYPRSDLLLSMALLNRLAGRGKQTLEELAEYYVASITPELAAKLRGLLAGQEGLRRALLARQPLLAAMRYVISEGHDRSRPPDGELKPLDVHSILLTHAIATSLGHHHDDEKKLAGYPASLVMELLRIGLLYQSDDLFASIDRFSRLWLEFGERIDVELRSSPRELLNDATSLEIEEILAMGFGLLAYTMSWKPNPDGGNPFMQPEFGTFDDVQVEHFLELVSDDLEGFKVRFETHTGEFDFLPFQQSPVWRSPAGLLVLDEGYLWDRITSGLYWVVHDYEKENHGETARLKWTQAYGQMIERMAEEQIEAMAPRIFGGGKTFYTEEDFQQAFDGKQADTGLDFGNAFVLLEIVSAQLSVPTRIEGDLEQFEKDTDRLVIKKCRQLHDVAMELLDDDSRLTGVAKSASLTIYPVVVVGGGYPIHPFTDDYIEEILRTEGILRDARIRRLAVVDIGELEILEGLAEEGPTIIEVLEGWKGSSLHSVALKNYVLSRYGRDQIHRPARMKEQVDTTFRTIVDQLGFIAPPQETDETD
jgi:hypothetical protein